MKLATMVSPRGFAVLGLLTLAFTMPAQAVPTLTLGAGVANPPPNLTLTGTANPTQVAIADTATVIPTNGLQPVLQATLTAQGFSNANNWFMVGNAAPLANNATFNLTTYNLFGNAGLTAAGENITFTLNPNLASPVVPNGSTATLHWLQLLNESQRFPTQNGNYGFAIPGQQGFWQLDNGDFNGAAAGGAAIGGNNGPYYDSNGGTIVPPTFSDSPKYYSGVGTYLHFDAIPTWDIFTPAGGGNPAKDTIDIADYGVAWGFVIVPEPSTIGLVAVVGVALSLRRRRVASV